MLNNEKNDSLLHLYVCAFFSWLAKLADCLEREGLEHAVAVAQGKSNDFSSRVNSMSCLCVV